MKLAPCYIYKNNEDTVWAGVHVSTSPD
jgi:hypothetical protein